MKNSNKKEIVIFETAKKIWSQIAKNSNEFNTDFELEIHKSLLNIFQVGDYYHYIFNCADQEIEFVHDNIVDVLGYAPSYFTVVNLLELIHPDDIPYFLNFENTVTHFFNQLSQEKIHKYKVRYDYRIKKSNGEYIRILQQVVTIHSDANGSVIRTLGVHTDISHLKKTNNMSLSFIGLEGEPSFHNVEVLTVLNPTKEILTQREKEILKLVLNGQNSMKIANLLNLSKHTIDTHRKNILKKTNCQTVNELIIKTINEGWI